MHTIKWARAFFHLYIFFVDKNIQNIKICVRDIKKSAVLLCIIFIIFNNGGNIAFFSKFIISVIQWTSDNGQAVCIEVQS